MAPTAFIDGLPKAELHVHIEGTLEPSMLLAFAERNAVPLPYSSEAEVRDAYRFRNLQEFLDLYYLGTQVLVTETDFRELTWAYLERARRQNVRHAEIFFDPQAHMRRGVDFGTALNGMRRACDAAADRLGISTLLIMCFLRHLSAEDAMATLQAALPYRDHIIAVGLDSSEAGNPPDKFLDVFARARAEGFLAVAHAGEEGPAGYVHQALDGLRVQRIDHGNRALEDDALVDRLAREQIPLTLCPLSNLKLGVIDDMAGHPLARMMRRGLMVTVNSDDPAYFGGYLNENYKAVAEALDLTDVQLCQLARNSFQASFLPGPEKARLIEVLAAAVPAP